MKPLFAGLPEAAFGEPFAGRFALAGLALPALALPVARLIVIPGSRLSGRRVFDSNRSATSLAMSIVADFASIRIAPT